MLVCINFPLKMILKWDCMICRNLKDLCLEGTLAPELKNLVHLKSM